MFLYVYTGFIQIFGSKIQDLFQTFFQNNKFFFQTHDYQMGDQYRPLKMQKQQQKKNQEWKFFFKMRCKRKG